MNSISTLAITANTLAIEHELDERRHDAAVHGLLRGLLHEPGTRLFGLARPTLRRQREPRQRPRCSSTACAS